MKNHSIKWVSVLLLASVPLVLVQGAAPSWWGSRAVILPNVPVDDFGAANQGQLKHIAHAAYLELGSQFSTQGGAGQTLVALMTHLHDPQTQRDDFAVVTVGEVKAMAKPFYQRLLALDVIQALPDWLIPTPDDDDYAVATVGQVKNAFSFELVPLSGDPDDDFDGDGLTDSEELQLGLNLRVRDSDGDGIEDGYEDSDQDGINNLSDMSSQTSPILGVSIYRPVEGEKL